MRHRELSLIVLATIFEGCAGSVSSTQLPLSTSSGRQSPGQLMAASFRTLEEARRALRAVPKQDLRAPMTVMVDGTSALSGPVVFDAADSGTSQAPIIYTADGDGIVTGGRRLTGWYRVAGEQSLWATHVGLLAFRQLFVNGQRMKPARTPKDGFFHVDGAPDFNNPVSFKFHEGEMSANWIGDQVVLLQKWGESRLPITAVDPATRTVTLANEVNPDMAEGDARYWVEGSAEFLDQPGEWYLDSHSGVVYYYARPDENLTAETVIVPTTATLIVLNGTRNVAFVGFRFEYTDWQLPSDGYVELQSAFDMPAAIMGSGVDSIAISDSRFAHLGTWAISFDQGSKNNTVSHNEMSDLGAGGVKLGEGCTDPASAGDTPRLETCPSNVSLSSGNRVENNTIHDIGNVYLAAAAIWLGQTYENSVCSNEIFDTNYTGVSVGWTWGLGWTAARDNLVAFNRIHAIGRGVLSDMGGIYTLGNQPGTTIRNNLIYGVTPYAYGGWGIYMDQGSSNILTQDNIVYGARSGAFNHAPEGGGNLIINNVFAAAEGGPVIFADVFPPLDVLANQILFQQNIFYGTKIFSGTPMPELRFDGNLYFDPISRQGISDPRAVFLDPLFTAPRLGDFSLSRNSPAYSMGFEHIQLYPTDGACR